MKKIISCLIVAALLLASVLAMIPASAAAPTEFNVMGNSNADMQWKGEGNVFYFDYHKFVGLQNSFPLNDPQKGATDLMLRLGSNNGSGTASVCDGVKNSGSFSHKIGTGTNINGIDYDHGFGYSFKESVIIDSIKLYIPEGTPITAIDVYGASYDPAGPTYGKEAYKTILASFTDVNSTATTDVDGVNVIVLESELYEALEIDYLFLALAVNGAYTFYEIEANGIYAKDSFEGFNDNALKAQLARCADLYEEDWTASSWANLVSALEAVVPVNQNASATEAQINTAANTLKNAIDALEAKPSDKSALNALISTANMLTESNYTPLTWANFVAALEQANAVSAASPISQTEVDMATSNLAAAIEALAAPASKTALSAVFEQYNALNESDFTPKTWEALQVAVAGATAVLKDESATQAEVDTATTVLEDAIEALELPGDKAKLETAITAAKNLVKSDYAVTTLVWNVFQKAIEDAEEVLADVNATQEDVDKALADLEEKVNSLESGDVTDEKNPPVNDDNNKDENDDEDADATEAPATDAPATDAPAPANKGCGSTVALSALAIVGVIGTALVIKKRD